MLNYIQYKNHLMNCERSNDLMVLNTSYCTNRKSYLVFNTAYQVLDTSYLVFSIQYVVSSTQYWITSTKYLILDIQYQILDKQYSIPDSRYSILLDVVLETIYIFITIMKVSQLYFYHYYTFITVMASAVFGNGSFQRVVLAFSSASELRLRGATFSELRWGAASARSYGAAELRFLQQTGRAASYHELYVAPPAK